MGYRIELVDMAAVSGGLVTFFGAMLLWLSTQGNFQISTPMEANGDLDKTSLQEELGKNIVAASVVEDTHAKDILRVAQKLNTETIAAQRINDSGNERVQQLVNESKAQERSNTARIEFVKGQSIVNGTLRAHRWHKLPEEQWKELNGRVIATAAKEGNRIDSEFRTTAPERFKTALENETEVHTSVWKRSQEQAGEVIVETTLVETEYEAAFGDVQEHIGLLVSRAAVSNLL